MKKIKDKPPPSQPPPQKQIPYDLHAASVPEMVETVSNAANPNIHNTSNSNIIPNQIKSRVPQVGDHVVAMWGMSKWQYFTATVVDYDSVNK